MTWAVEQSGGAAGCAGRRGWKAMQIPDFSSRPPLAAGLRALDMRMGVGEGPQHKMGAGRGADQGQWEKRREGVWTCLGRGHWDAQ